MFNSYETKLLEYLLDHKSASREDLDHAFTDRYMYSSALDDLVRLGVVKWDFDLYDGRYIISDNWQSYLTKNFRLRDNLAQLDAQKAAKKEIEKVKSERFKLIYSSVISFVIILVVLSVSLLRKGLPLFSVNSLLLLAFVAGASFLVVLPAFLVLTSFPTMLDYSPEAAPALPATIIGSTSLALALALAIFL